MREGLEIKYDGDGNAKGKSTCQGWGGASLRGWPSIPNVVAKRVAERGMEEPFGPS